jgi:hypothetical protein
MPIVGELEKRRLWRDLLNLIADFGVVYVPADSAFEFIAI